MFDDKNSFSSFLAALGKGLTLADLALKGSARDIFSMTIAEPSVAAAAEAGGQGGNAWGYLEALTDMGELLANAENKLVQIILPGGKAEAAALLQGLVESLGSDGGQGGAGAGHGILDELLGPFASSMASSQAHTDFIGQSASEVATAAPLALAQEAGAAQEGGFNNGLLGRLLSLVGLAHFFNFSGHADEPGVTGLLAQPPAPESARDALVNSLIAVAPLLAPLESSNFYTFSADGNTFDTSLVIIPPAPPAPPTPPALNAQVTCGDVHVENTTNANTSGGFADGMNDRGLLLRIVNANNSGVRQ